MTKNNKKYDVLFEYGKLFAKINTKSYIKLKKEIIEKYGEKGAEIFELGAITMIDTYKEVYSKTKDNDDVLKKLAIDGNLHAWSEETCNINEDYINESKTMKKSK